MCNLPSLGHRNWVHFWPWNATGLVGVTIFFAPTVMAGKLAFVVCFKADFQMVPATARINLN